MADAALAELASLAAGNVARDVHGEVRALRYYFQDMCAALGELARVMVPGKRLALIVGDSYRRGTPFLHQLRFAEWQAASALS